MTPRIVGAECAQGSGRAQLLSPIAPVSSRMKDRDLPERPLDPVEALMSIRVILDATADKTASMPVEVALRLIDSVLTKALPSFRPRGLLPDDDDSSPP
jgi:hypothetical protein